MSTACTFPTAQPSPQRAASGEEEGATWSAMLGPGREAWLLLPSPWGALLSNVSHAEGSASAKRSPPDASQRAQPCPCTPQHGTRGEQASAGSAGPFTFCFQQRVLHSVCRNFLQTPRYTKA